MYNVLVCVPVGNEIAHVDGLEGLEQLVELVLDRNKIKVRVAIKLTIIDLLIVTSFSLCSKAPLSLRVTCVNCT